MTDDTSREGARTDVVSAVESITSGVSRFEDADKREVPRALAVIVGIPITGVGCLFAYGAYTGIVGAVNGYGDTNFSIGVACFCGLFATFFLYAGKRCIFPAEDGWLLGPRILAVAAGFFVLMTGLALVGSLATGTFDAKVMLPMFAAAASLSWVAFSKVRSARQGSA